MGRFHPNFGGRILAALRERASAVCDDCLALKLALSRNDVLATVRALQAEDPPALLVYPGFCDLCRRIQRVMRIPVDTPAVTPPDPRCPVCGKGIQRDRGVAAADDRGVTHVHLECLDVFRARRRPGPDAPA